MHGHPLFSINVLTAWLTLFQLARFEKSHCKYFSEKILLYKTSLFCKPKCNKDFEWDKEMDRKSDVKRVHIDSLLDTAAR